MSEPKKRTRKSGAGVKLTDRGKAIRHDITLYPGTADKIKSATNKPLSTAIQDWGDSLTLVKTK